MNCRWKDPLRASVPSCSRLQSRWEITARGRLWSREWERTFEVSLVWKEGDKPLSGRAACEWAEAAGIAALEEVVSFLPRWALVTKRTDGLLEGWKSFEIE